MVIEEGGGVKSRRSDSFLRRLVKSSRDNIAEGCERLARNIQRSPLPVLRRKLLSSSVDEERPTPPLRRKKSRREIGRVSSDRPLPPVRPALREASTDSKRPREIGGGRAPPNDFVGIRVRGKSEDSSRSVSAEDVEDLIRAEDNRRLVERRAAIGRRSSGPGRGRSRSEESLARRVGPSSVRGESQVGRSAIVWRRNASAGSAERRSSKAKRSPPPDDWQVGDRGCRGLEPRRDNERWNGSDDKAEARKSRIRGGGEVDARLSAAAAWLVKCKVANSAENGGDEEEDDDDEDEEETRGSEENGPRRGSEVAVGDDGPVDDEGDSSIVAASASRSPVRSRVVLCPSIPGRIDPATGDDARVVVGGTDLVTIRVVKNEDARLKGGGGGGGGGGGASSNEGRDNKRGARRRVGESGEEEWKEDRKMKLAVRMIRIRDKLMLGLSAFAILFTVLLVMDLQMDLGYSGHHLVPSHGRVRVGDDPNTDTIYNNFRRKFLQRLNASREQTSGDTSATTQTNGGREGGGNEGGRRDSRTEKTEVHDSFPDLADLVVKGYGVSVYEGVARISGEDRSDNPTLGELKKIGPK